MVSIFVLIRKLGTPHTHDSPADSVRHDGCDGKPECLTTITWDIESQWYGIAEGTFIFRMSGGEECCSELHRAGHNATSCYYKKTMGEYEPRLLSTLQYSHWLRLDTHFLPGRFSPLQVVNYCKVSWCQRRTELTSSFRLPNTESGVPVRACGVELRGAGPSLVTSA